MQLKAVFFDVGGTLETFNSTPESWLKSMDSFRECLQNAGIHLDMDDVQLCEIISSGIATYQKWNRQSFIELPTVEIWTKYVFKDLGISEESIAAISEKLSFLYETKDFMRKLRPEIPEVLEKIKTMGLAIGCISNTQSLTQVPYALKKYGIDHYFNPVVLSSAFGHRKPDPSIFYHAARLLNLPTGSIVYVGDKISRDILGPIRSGFRLAIQIRHPNNEEEPDVGATPDAVINNMQELIPILENEIGKDKQSMQHGKERKIKGIFFDAGNILYHKPHKGMNMKRFLSKHKLHAELDVREEKRKLKDLAFHGTIDRFEFYERVIRLYGVTDPDILAEGINAMVRDATAVEIIEGVPETLKALKKKGFILGIISDTATPIQVKLDWFTKAGFGNVFDSFISSKEIGTRKPASLIYEEAFRKVGLKAGESVFVGHKASELKGARTVGMATIAFNYDKNAKADFYIEKFTELLEVKILNG
ncbi:MAG: HAD family hydrolase [Anaerolineaceae bacterium]